MRSHPKNLDPVFAALACLTVIFGTSPAWARTGPLQPPQTFRRGPQNLYALSEPNLFAHSAGLLSLQVTNVGVFGNPFITDLSAGWRGAEYLFYSGLWIGAIAADSQAHVSTCTPFELRPEVPSSWTIYRSFEGIEGGARPGPGVAAADDDGDGQIDEDFQNGLDDDGDGMIDEDFQAIGQQMFSCMYKDDTPEAVAALPDHYPLNLLVRQRSFQWSSPGRNEFVGIDYEIINSGEQRLENVYLGFFCDSDVGPKTAERFYSDDLVGWDLIDTTIVDRRFGGSCFSFDLEIPTAFMWDPAGNGVSPAGDVPGVFGTVFLGNTTDPEGILAPQGIGPTTIAWFLTSGFPTLATTDAERYQVLADTEFPTQYPLGGVATGSAVGPEDYCYVLGVGPFATLDPGESLNLQCAHAIGEGFTGFRQSAVAAEMTFRGRYWDADGDPQTGIDGKERCLRVLAPGDLLLWADPCDTSTVLVWRSTECLWVDADCSPCTGVEGKETAQPWVSLLAPPSPGANLDFPAPGNPPEFSVIVPPAGNGRVTVQWDNASECWQDPLTGVDIFEGYRIWKIDAGPGIPAAPSPGAWTRIAEFRLHPESGLGTEDPAHLIHVTNEGVEPIGVTSHGKDIYPIGRYEFVDAGVTNGNAYFYDVTAFGLSLLPDPQTGALVMTEIAGLPTATVHQAVVPCDTCGVVPVRLLSFTAERAGALAVLRWTVTDAEDHAGFHVYREEQGRARVRLSKTLLTGRPTYEFTDPDAPAGPTEYWLEEWSRTGARTWYGPAHLTPRPGLPGVLAAGPATPNPFTDRMLLSYSVPDGRRVRISVYDLSGRQIRLLADLEQGPGSFTATWMGETDSGVRAAPGLYILRLEAGAEGASREVFLIR